MSRRTAVLTAALALATPGSSAETHTFTNREGKTIEAEITTVRDGKVYLKSGGRSYAVEIVRLSDADQAWLRQWVRNHFDFNLSFRASPVELREKRTSRRGENKEKWETEIWRYEVEITNRSGVGLENVTVDYHLLVRNEQVVDPGRGRRTKSETAQLVSGTQTVPTLVSGDSAKVSSQEVTLKGHEWQVRREQWVTSTNGGREKEYWWDNYDNQSKLDGIWVRVYLHDRLVGEWKSQGKLIKEHTWAYEKKAAPPAPGIPDLSSEPDRPPETPESLPAPTPAGNRTLEGLLLSRRIQRKVREIRQDPTNPKLMAEYRELVEEQRRLLGRQRNSGPF